jgi:hypothetical protein
VLREFGLEQLDAEGEGTATREALASYYLALAEEANSQLQGCEQKSWRNQLVHEHDNLRAALNWWLEQDTPEAAERALRLWWAQAQSRFNPPCYRERYANVKRILALRAGVAEAMQVKALLYAAAVLRSVDEVEQSKPLIQEALALARQIGDLPSIAFAVQNLGGIAVFPVT